MEFVNDNSLKAYLNNESKKMGISIRNIYNTFFSRKLLEKISKIGCKNLFVKGSFSEFVNLGKMERPIKDIDIASPDSFAKGFSELTRCIKETNDDLSYELLDEPKITNTGIYKIKLSANFGKIKHPLHIDFHQYENTTYEKNYKLVAPIFKHDNAYKVLTPSYEEHLAEKLCIIVETNKEDKYNTRLKDFYDIYKMYGGKYDIDKLSNYFMRKLEDRNKVNLDGITIDYLNDQYIDKHQPIWDRAKISSDFIDKNLKLNEVVYKTKDILSKELGKLEKKGKVKIK